MYVSSFLIFFRHTSLSPNEEESGSGPQGLPAFPGIPLFLAGKWGFREVLEFLGGSLGEPSLPRRFPQDLAYLSICLAAAPTWVRLSTTVTPASVRALIFP